MLTLMLRRIKVLPLGLGEEVVEDSLDFLFEVPASMRPRRRPEVIASRRRRPTRPARRQGQLRDGQRRQVHLQALLRELREAKREVESEEEPSSSTTTSVYCQVGTSIFDRWEQITLIDPEWVR